LELLLECSNIILESDDFKKSAQNIFDMARELTKAASGCLTLFDDDEKKDRPVIIEIGDRFSCSVSLDTPMQFEGMRGETYKTGQVIVENDYTDFKKIELVSLVSLYF
jgi:hypothetical protein